MSMQVVQRRQTFASEQMQVTTSVPAAWTPQRRDSISALPFFSLLNRAFHICRGMPASGCRAQENDHA
jgi:hypothetical protein